jgi:hypothetical protein
MVAKSPGQSRRGARAPHTVGSVIGTVLGVILIVGGLAVAGAVVLVYVAFSQFGSNK